MTFAEIEQTWIQAGGNPAEAPTAAAIAMAESGGDPSNTTGDNGTSYGLWQIHWTVHPQFNPSDLTNPLYNAAAAIAISGNGQNWNPWTTFMNGSYLKYLPSGVQNLLSGSSSGGWGGGTPSVTAADWTPFAKWMTISALVVLFVFVGWGALKNAI